MAAKKKSTRKKSAKKTTKKSTPRKKAKRQSGGAQGQGEFRSSPEVRTALLDGNTFRGKAVQYAVVDGMAIYEGDIVLGTVEEVEARSEQIRAEMAGEVASGVIITGDQFRWPDCTIPYTIDSSLPNQSRVTNAIAHWEANTRFNFVPRTSEADYVTFRPASGCSSMVGRQGGQQFVNLASGCTTGNCIHEIGHVVGLWHEQSREDRDSFVTINWAKIMSGFEHNFNQHISDGDDVGPYDYGSIMHYPRTAFSVDGSDTITPVDPTADIGQRTALSAGDISAANSMCPVVKAPWETIKEITKDIRFDTRKEIMFDTRKEIVFDTVKEVAFDPGGGTWAERVTLPGRVVTRPGGRRLTTGVTRPFAVATPHRAPAASTADAGCAGESTIGHLDAQLEALAEQIGQLDAQRDMLQAQYDETAALLEEAVREHDASPGS